MAEESKKIVEPYLTALGSVVYAWNDLIETLGQLFCAILYPREASPSIAWGIWHSIESDRAQIRMLRAAAFARFKSTETTLPTARDDIKWLCKRVGCLATARNTTIHTPLVTRLENNEVVDVVPHNFFGHPRAEELRKKDLMSEFAWQTEYATTLRLFALRMVATIYFGAAQRAWPERPQLPNRGQRKKDIAPDQNS